MGQRLDEQVERVRVKPEGALRGHLLSSCGWESNGSVSPRGHAASWQHGRTGSGKERACRRPPGQEAITAPGGLGGQQTPASHESLGPLSEGKATPALTEDQPEWQAGVQGGPGHRGCSD